MTEKKSMVDAAMIVAADSDGHRVLFGVSAIRRLTRLLLDAGIADIRIAVAKVPVPATISDLVHPTCFHAIADEASVDRLVRAWNLPDSAEVLILRANHVIDRRTFNDFIADRKTPAPRLLRARDGKPEHGLILANPRQMPGLLKTVCGFSAATPFPLDEFHQQVSPVDLPVICSAAGSDVQKAETRLVRALARQTDEHDGFMARFFDRRLSQMISRKLAHTRIAPNTITVLGVAIGLGGAFLLSRPGYWAQLIGSLLFLFCVVVDGVDGEVARLALKESIFGHYLDIITDNLVHVAIFIGIGIGLYRQTGSTLYLHALGAMLGGFVICLVAVHQCVLSKSPEQLERSPGLLRFLTLLTNRDFAYLIVVLALLGRLAWFLLGAAAGTYLFAAALWMVDRYEKKTALAG